MVTHHRWKDEAGVTCVRALLVCIVQYIHVLVHAPTACNIRKIVDGRSTWVREQTSYTSCLLENGQLSGLAPPSPDCYCSWADRRIVYLAPTHERKRRQKGASKKAHIKKIKSSIKLILPMTMLFLLFGCLPKKSPYGRLIFSNCRKGDVV